MKPFAAPTNSPAVCINLNDAMLIARGSQRACYQHPDDPGKCIKVNFHPDGKQQQREYRYFIHLRRRGIPFRHIPAFYGTIETDLGTGLLFERISDHDGTTSASLDAYVKREGMKDIPAALQAMKTHFLEWNIITCDMSLNNFMVRRNAEDGIEIVMIDGVGNREAIPLSSVLTIFGRMKMQRRWTRFERKLEPLDKVAF
jgi:hypothetical protein